MRSLPSILDPRLREARGTLAVCLAVGLLATACTAVVDPGTLASTGEAKLVISAEAAARAEALLDEATVIEPELTGLLTEGAERLGINMWGLPYRVKSRKSLERKIQTRMLERGLSAEDVTIDDVLRYTAVIEDSPPGHHNAAVAEILGRAEARGFPPVEVKNYWPEGDSYSGINCVLTTPSGLRWELQFHTVGSLAAKQEGHQLYEAYRLPTTPLKQRRRLFDQLAERWAWVQVPEGILEPGSLHRIEEIKSYPRP